MKKGKVRHKEKKKNEITRMMYVGGHVTKLIFTAMSYKNQTRTRTPFVSRNLVIYRPIDILKLFTADSSTSSRVDKGHDSQIDLVYNLK